MGCQDANDFIEKGQELYKKRENERAILNFLKAVELDPENIRAYRGLSTVYSVEGDTDRALEALRKINAIEKCHKKTETEKQKKNDENSHLLSEPVNELFMWSQRVKNRFKEQDIETIGDLVNKTDETFLKMKSFGKLCLQEVKDNLESIGLSTLEGKGKDKKSVYSCINCVNLKKAGETICCSEKMTKEGVYDSGSRTKIVPRCGFPCPEFK